MADGAAPPVIPHVLTAGQIACFIFEAGCILLWLYAELLERTTRTIGKGNGDGSHTAAKSDGGTPVTAAPPVAARNSPKVSLVNPDEKAPDTEAPVRAPPTPEPVAILCGFDNPVTRVLRLQTSALIEHRVVIKTMVEFALLLNWYFICDRTNLLHASGEKSYSRDTFWFIYLILVAYCFATSLGKNKAVAYLNREQTEEWKGWMQILFLMYHYFNAAEQYNSIRMWIAAYVWQTGFGNFSFYYVRKDFSPGRFFQMVWRLNFLVFWACNMLANDYMCYYICAMHTLWTFFVYFSLMFFYSHNDKNWVITLKFIGCGALVAFLFSSRQIWDTVWAPLYPVIQYVNPRAKAGTPGADPTHEWYFRAGLDRYVWMFGMLCANLHPRTSAFLEWMDGLSSAAARTSMRALMGGTLLAMLYGWYVKWGSLGKLEYNKVHPYTSWIPILCFILLRNLTPTLRGWSLHFFGFLGKITLETYIGQYSIWMTTLIPNGQPKNLLILIPDYPLLNFMLTTSIYVWVSLRLFECTNTIKVAFLPSKDETRLYRNLIIIVCTWLPIYALGRVARMAFPPAM